MRPDGLRGNEKIKYLEEIDEPLYVVVNLCDLQQKAASFLKRLRVNDIRVKNYFAISSLFTCCVPSEPTTTIR
jgi:hypothetical protein